MKLTPVERTILLNQYRILAILVPSESEHYGRLADTLVHQYERLYRDAIPVYTDDPHDVDACDHVDQILQMFRTIDAALRQIPSVDPDVRSRLTFDGYDRHDEWECGYVEFQVQDRARWSELRGRELNSHSPRRRSYDRMYEAWRASVDPISLTLEDLLRISEARRLY